MKRSGLTRALPAGFTREVLVGGAGTFGIRALGMLLMALASLVLARALGSVGYGRYAWAFAWVNILALTSILGFDRLLVRDLSRFIVRNEPSLIRGLLLMGHQVVLLAAIGAAAIAGVVATITLTTTDQQLTVFLAAMALVPLLALNLLRQAALQAHGRVIASRWPDDLLRPALLTLFVLGVVAAWPGRLAPTGAMALHVAAALVTFVVGGLMLRRTVASSRGALAERRAKEWLRDAAPLWWIGVGTVLLTQVDVVLVGLLSSTENAGVYEIGSRLAAVAGLVEFGLNAAISPLVARRAAEGDLTEVQERVGKIAALGLVGTIVSAVVVSIGGALVLELYGEAFVEARPVLVIVTAAYVFSAACGPNGALLAMAGHSRPASQLMGGAVVVNIVANVALVPLFGLIGAAWAWLLTVVVWNALMVRVAHRILGFDASIAGLVLARLRRR